MTWNGKVSDNEELKKCVGKSGRKYFTRLSHNLSGQHEEAAKNLSWNSKSLGRDRSLNNYRSQDLKA